MNVYSAMVRIFSLDERLIVPFNKAIAKLNGTINLSPNKNIHYLFYIIPDYCFSKPIYSTFKTTHI